MRAASIVAAWLVLVACDDARDRASADGGRTDAPRHTDRFGEATPSRTSRDAGSWTSAGNACPDSYLGCDHVAPARRISDCTFETTLRPDSVRVRGDADGGAGCLAHVADCDHDSGWQQATTDAGAVDRMRFHLCAEACTALIDRPDAHVEAVSLCRE